MGVYDFYKTITITYYSVVQCIRLIFKCICFKILGLNPICTVTSGTFCICTCTHIYTYIRIHIVCQVVFVWEKACLVAVFVVFLPKMRNNRMTGRFSSINPACCIVALSVYRSEQDWYACVHVCTYIYSRNWLGTRSWRHIVASYIENHSRVDCTGSVYVHTHVCGWNTRALDVGGQ